MEKLLKERNEAGFQPDHFFGDSKEDSHQIGDLCSKIFGRKLVELRVSEPGEVVQAHSAFFLSPTYFRALAKIGFHAYLFFHQNLSGFEPEFDGIKRFIYYGKVPNRYVRASPNPLIDTKDLITPAHIVACDWNQHSLQTRIQLFASLEGNMQVIASMQGDVQLTTRQGELVWVVILGRNPSRLIFEDRCGAIFQYFKAPPYDGYHGRMLELRGTGRALPIARLLKRH